MACVTWCEFEGDIPVKEPPTKLAKWEIELSTFSNWLRNEILQHVFVDGEVFTPPSQLYVAQHSTVSSALLPGTELSGDGYARVPVTFARVSDIKLWNPTRTSTPIATAPWTVLSMSIWDSVNIGEGNYYAFGNLTATLTVDTGKAIVYPAQTGIIIGMGSPP